MHAQKEDKLRFRAVAVLVLHEMMASRARDYGLVVLTSKQAVHTTMHQTRGSFDRVNSRIPIIRSRDLSRLLENERPFMTRMIYAYKPRVWSIVRPVKACESQIR
nr:hypothetical protein CFP56_43712 [Quercus suber]